MYLERKNAKEAGRIPESTRNLLSGLEGNIGVSGLCGTIFYMGFFLFVFNEGRISEVQKLNEKFTLRRM